MTRAPRWVRWLRAVPFGYFWKACPLCDDPFGGNEPGTGCIGFPEARAHCPRCTQVIARYLPLRDAELRADVQSAIETPPFLRA